MSDSASKPGNNVVLADPESNVTEMTSPQVLVPGAPNVEVATATDEDSNHINRNETDEDEEVRLAMEMALAAAKNPRLTPDQLRQLVGGKNKQLVIVDQKKEEQKRKEREEAQKKWNEQKEKAMNWWSGVSRRASELTVTAVQKAEEIKFLAEKQYYADQIKQDPQVRETRKKIKVLRKTLKAHRLQGNRVETRHMFKRQRMEKRYMQVREKLSKNHRLLIKSNYNVQEYAKAMMRASRKWRKKGTDEELALEAQLCRNMHQMLVLEKQKSKLKKSSREMKKYLQRCKGWLSDKMAFCELHLMTLDATSSSMEALFQDTLSKQDKLISKLVNSDEYKDQDLSAVDVSHFDALGSKDVPGSTIRALRGLPLHGIGLRDSIRLAKEHAAKLSAEQSDHVRSAESAKAAAATASGPELFVETKDDISVDSGLSDPDGGALDQEGVAGAEDSDSDIGFQFGKDAPWMASATSLNSSDGNLNNNSMELSNSELKSPAGLVPPAAGSPSRTSSGSSSLPLKSKNSSITRGESNGHASSSKEFKKSDPSSRGPLEINSKAIDGEAGIDSKPPYRDDGFGSNSKNTSKKSNNMAAVVAEADESALRRDGGVDSSGPPFALHRKESNAQDTVYSTDSSLGDLAGMDLATPTIGMTPEDVMVVVDKSHSDHHLGHAVDDDGLEINKVEHATKRHAATTGSNLIISAENAMAYSNSTIHYMSDSSQEEEDASPVTSQDVDEGVERFSTAESAGRTLVMEAVD